jgi:3-deoxy-D-manno-octulosonate 8-phosphate phosphatase (KDO 8-P phosphatase)
MSPLTDDLKKRFLKISLLLLDVDGVLTDGRIILDDEGKESKHFDVKDGHGIKMLLRVGIRVIFLTGRTSRVVSFRAQDLGIGEVYQGAKNKVAVLDSLIRSEKIPEEQIAYVGDDVVDIPLFKRVGLSVAVADACDDARKAAHYVTERKGGQGAVREVCEMILRLQGKWDEVIARYERL